MASSFSSHGRVTLCNPFAEEESFHTACKLHAKCSPCHMHHVTLWTFPDRDLPKSPKTGFKSETSLLEPRLFFPTSFPWLCWGAACLWSQLLWLTFCAQNWYDFHDNNVMGAGNLSYWVKAMLPSFHFYYGWLALQVPTGQLKSPDSAFFQDTKCGAFWSSRPGVVQQNGPGRNDDVLCR